MNDNLKRLAGVVARAVLLKVSLPVLLIAVGLIVVIVLIIASFIGSQDFGETGSLKGGNKQLSEQVLEWEEDVKDAVIEESLDLEYVHVLLAILQQESGGDMISSNGDIFQSSESKCGSIGCITDPQESIKQAVKHFKNNVSNAKGNKEVAIQSYNFGNGFADWTQKNHDNKWSREIAIEFSQHMMTKVNNPSNYTCIRKEAKPHGACYGDILYVPTIVDYLPDGNNSEETQGVEFTGNLIFPTQPVIVTSNFGKRISPGGTGSTNHNGIDLGCTGGITPIQSAGIGEVVYSQFNAGGYGNTVIIKHAEDFYTHYAHMTSLNVDENDFVSEGDQIGVCGNTGDSYGAHLHFETKTSVWNGASNPRNFKDFPAKR